MVVPFIKSLWICTKKTTILQTFFLWKSKIDQTKFLKLAIKIISGVIRAIQQHLEQESGEMNAELGYNGNIKDVAIDNVNLNLFNKFR